MAYEPEKDIETAAIGAELTIDPVNRLPCGAHKAEEIVVKLRQVDVLNVKGKSMAEANRSIGVTEVTYYRWRSEYGGLKRVSPFLIQDSQSS